MLLSNKWPSKCDSEVKVLYRYALQNVICTVECVIGWCSVGYTPQKMFFFCVCPFLTLNDTQNFRSFAVPILAINYHSWMTNGYSIFDVFLFQR